MEEGDSRFDDFSIEMGDFMVAKLKQHDRMWNVGPGGSIMQIPVIRYGIVYFGSCNFNMYAADVRTGELVWKYRTDEKILESSPTLYEGKVFVGSHDYCMYALDAKTGKLKWKFRTEGEIDVKADACDGKVYFVSRDQNLYCVDALRGEFIWKFHTQGEIVACPTVHEGKVFVGSYDQNFYCIDSETGMLIWKFHTQGEVHHLNHCLVRAGIVYFTSFDNYLRAVDIGKGTLIWKFRTGIYGNDSCPVFYKGRLYQNSRDGFLYALTLDGKEIWRYRKKDTIGIPGIFEDRIYVGGEDNFLTCLDLDGNVLWRYETQGPVFIQPVLWERAVIFSSWDCNVYAVDIGTRKLLWKFHAPGGPCPYPPAYESFEVQMKIPEPEIKEGEKKAYDLTFESEDELNASSYKSRITYQVSTQYASKGKYQVDTDEEEF